MSTEATYAGITNQDIINAFFAVDQALLPRAFPDWIAELIGPNGSRRNEPYTGPKLADALGPEADPILAQLKPRWPAGRGVWIKSLDGLPTGEAGLPLSEAIVDDARQLRATWVVVKLGHAEQPSNAAQTVRDLATRLRRQLGAVVWGYHFVLNSGERDSTLELEQQANRAVTWALQSGVQGLALWLSDMGDGRWGSAWTANAVVREARIQRYLQVLREGLGPNFPLALAAPARPERHPGIPWAALLSQVDLLMPQIFGVDDSPAAELQSAGTAWNAGDKPALPVLRAFGNSGYTLDTLYDLDEHAASLYPAWSGFEWRFAVDGKLWPALAGRRAHVVQRRRDQLLLNGQPYRFIGVNVRELIQYGNHSIGMLDLTKDKHIGEQLDGTRAIGGAVARVFLAHTSYDPANGQAVDAARAFLNDHGLPFDRQPADPAETLQLSLEARLEHVLSIAGGPRDNLRPNPVRILPAFIDYNDHSGFFLPGDRPFYINGFLEHPDWYSHAWQDHYWPFVRRIIRRFRGDPRIFAWELGNEVKLPADPALFIRWAGAVAARIKQLDPVHLVLPGIISLAHCAFSPEQAAAFYGDPYLDAGTLHLAGDQFPPIAEFQDFGLDPMENSRRSYIERDLAVAHQQGKPLIIEEAGYLVNRRENLAALRDFAFSRGAVGFLPWGFSAVGDGDIRIGDILWGLDNFHPHEGGDFRAIAMNFSAFAGETLASRMV